MASRTSLRDLFISTAGTDDFSLPSELSFGGAMLGETTESAKCDRYSTQRTSVPVVKRGVPLNTPLV